MNKSISTTEFVVLMALLTALGAMATDAMLPALNQIGLDLGVLDPNKAQFIIYSIFMGFAVGQIIYGPLSDSIGRKNSIYISLSIFIFGCFLSMLTDNLWLMLFARFLQGFGASGPKIVAMALVRDIYSGRKMASIMSFVAMVFVLVPAIAPIIGGFILKYSNWKGIFFMFAISGIISFLWLAIRQEETLPKSKRKPLSKKTIMRDIVEVLSHKKTMAYTTILGIVFGGFMSYLSTAQQIFVFTYSLGENFPLYFAVNALVFGLASIINAKLVLQLGMHYLCKKAILGLTSVSLIFTLVVFATNGNLSLILFMTFCLIGFFFIGILFGNLNALAMEPMGHIAGTAAAVIGFASISISLPIGIVIGQLYNGTVAPMIISFGTISLVVLFLWNKTHSPKSY